MSYLRRIEGFKAEREDFARYPRTSHGEWIDAHVWVFTDGLVITRAPRFTEPWFANAVKALEGAELETLEPEIIAAADPTAVRLDQARVCRVDYAGPRKLPYIKRGFGRFHVYFFFEDESWFHLIVPRANEDDVWALLRDTYPGKVEDHREDLR